MYKLPINNFLNTKRIFNIKRFKNLILLKNKIKIKYILITDFIQ